MSSLEKHFQCAVELKIGTFTGAQPPLTTLHLIKHLDVVRNTVSFDMTNV